MVLTILKSFMYSHVFKQRGVRVKREHKVTIDGVDYYLGDSYCGSSKIVYKCINNPKLVYIKLNRTQMEKANEVLDQLENEKLFQNKILPERCPNQRTKIIDDNETLVFLLFKWN